MIFEFRKSSKIDSPSGIRWSNGTVHWDTLRSEVPDPEGQKRPGIRPEECASLLPGSERSLIQPGPIPLLITRTERLNARNYGNFVNSTTLIMNEL